MTTRLLAIIARDHKTGEFNSVLYRQPESNLAAIAAIASGKWLPLPKAVQFYACAIVCVDTGEVMKNSLDLKPRRLMELVLQACENPEAEMVTASSKMAASIRGACGLQPMASPMRFRVGLVAKGTTICVPPIRFMRERYVGIELSV